MLAGLSDIEAKANFPRNQLTLCYSWTYGATIGPDADPLTLDAAPLKTPAALTLTDEQCCLGVVKNEKLTANYSKVSLHYKNHSYYFHSETTVAKVLHIDSSPNLLMSYSRQLSKAFVDKWQQARPEDEIIIRDIGKDMPPHIDGLALGSFFLPPDQHNDEMKQRAALSDELVEEFLAADIIVLGVPMYNFSIPSNLKAYIDQITRVGKTFRYTENGAEGLVKGKNVYIMAAAGGLYEGSGIDFQIPYLAAILAFLGIENVVVVRAEGLNIDEEYKQKSMADALQKIEKLFA